MLRLRDLLLRVENAEIRPFGGAKPLDMLLYEALSDAFNQGVNVGSSNARQVPERTAARINELMDYVNVTKLTEKKRSGCKNCKFAWLDAVNGPQCKKNPHDFKTDEQRNIVRWLCDIYPREAWDESGCPGFEPFQ
jgi:hypothetical protein